MRFAMLLEWMKKRAGNGPVPGLQGQFLFLYGSYLETIAV